MIGLFFSYVPEHIMIEKNCNGAFAGEIQMGTKRSMWSETRPKAENISRLKETVV